MKKIGVEIQVTLLAIFILVAVVLSGQLVYESLSQIVNSIHKEARPDMKLMLIKKVVSDLTEVENTVRLYTLSNDDRFFRPYQELRKSIDDKSTSLKDYLVSDEQTKIYIDSLQLLTLQKLVIWDDILNLHISKADASTSFEEYYEKLDTTTIEKDTIYFEEPVKQKGIFKRIFGKKKEAPKPIIVDNSQEREKIREDVAAIEQKITKNTQQIAARETALLKRNIHISGLLRELIQKLENIEQRNLRHKTQEADRLASVTYKRLGLFIIAAVVLMLLVLLIFFRDLRKSRKYQRVLKEAKTEAEKLARAKELFVATVSHEMRTPINAIHGLTEQILNRKHDKKTQKDIEVINKSAVHLTTLVNDTFDFSKIENQKLQLEPVDFSLDELLDDVIVYNKRNALEKGIRLILDRSNTAGKVLFADPVRLKQILINLLTNAIKFTDEGKVTLKASCDDYANSVTLNVDVIDTGIGIASGSLQLIFKDFVQLETNITKKAKGTGLGLYIVKRLTDLLGGQIHVESEKSVGTTFKLSIPFPLGDASNIRSLKPELIISDKLKAMQILIVDDEEFNRHLLKNILNNWGLKYDEVENGKEAVDQSQLKQYDLILMDIRMPEMNGFEAVQLLRGQEYSAKIIALTADKDDGNFKKYEEAGFDNYLHKPFSENELHKKINDSLALGSELNVTDENVLNVEESIRLEDLERMSNGDDSFLKEMIEIFISSSTNNLSLIEACIHENDWAELAEIAHKMAAPAKHMNVMPLYDRVKKIEQLAEDAKDIDELKSQLTFLNRDVSAVNNHLGKLLKEI